MDPTPTFTVELQPILEWVYMILAAVIPPVLTWLIVTVSRRWLKIKLDDEHRAVLDMALRNGALWALDKGRDALGNVSIQTKNAAIATTANYVIKSTPDALRHFGISADRLNELIEARIAGVLADNNNALVPAPAAPGSSG